MICSYCVPMLFLHLTISRDIYQFNVSYMKFCTLRPIAVNAAYTATNAQVDASC